MERERRPKTQVAVKTGEAIRGPSHPHPQIFQKSKKQAERERRRESQEFIHSVSENVDPAMGQKMQKYSNTEWTH